MRAGACLEDEPLRTTSKRRSMARKLGSTHPVWKDARGFGTATDPGSRVGDAGGDGRPAAGRSRKKYHRLPRHYLTVSRGWNAGFQATQKIIQKQRAHGVSRAALLCWWLAYHTEPEIRDFSSKKDNKERKGMDESANEQVTAKMMRLVVRKQRKNKCK